MKVCGIDEAGRGSLIGPLVIAGVCVSEEKIEKLKEIGVKDSKKLSREKREELYKQIESICEDIVVLRISPCTIDLQREAGINLDKIEAMKIAQIIDVINADKIYIDSLEQNSKNFEKLIKEFLNNKNANLVVENYLDESVPVVSAASIIAKVERDRVIDEIKKEVGIDFGTGYPHDPLTINFIEILLKEKKELPTFVRKSWISIEILKEKIAQKKLSEFLIKS